VELQRVNRLIADLDHDRFEVRERALVELAKLGKQVEPALRKALQSRTTAEVRLRVGILLKKLDDLAMPPEDLQALRATVVLERIGSPEARQVLQALAGGAPEARLTREAKASLVRLAKRPVATR
jgi:hypothetical protein